MRNLYVFAIGGSGERVLKSLVLTLASGVTPNVKQVIPVFVDNDEKSNALLKCLDLIRFYNSDPRTDNQMGANTLYHELTDNVEEWPSFCKTKIAKPILLNKAGGNIGNLGKVIGKMDEKNPYLAELLEERDLLFTPDDLNMPLNVGFVGNPNIGSVVLNSLSLSDKNFTDIVGAVSSNDGVIVVGSLFGGTGAAGFPLIINTFNKIDGGNRPLLGGVAVLPYFALNGEDGTNNILDTTKYDVDSDSFDTKARAALMYYDDYMRGMDFCYYVGDSKAKDIYPHFVGGKKQENPTHLVELMAAMSIIEFANQDVNNKPNSIAYKTPIWGINVGEGTVVPTNFSGIRNSELKKALVKFKMMHELFANDSFLKWAIKEKKDYVANIGFTESMRMSLIDERSSQQVSYSYGFYHIIQAWLKWIDDLGRDKAKRQFLLYDKNMSPTDDNLTKMFYSNGKAGIAKTEKVMVGIPFVNQHEVERVVPARVAESLQKVYRALNIKDQTIEEAKRLPIMLQIISKALDDVIENKCIAM